jgi:hypothetical protein
MKKLITGILLTVWLLMFVFTASALNDNAQHDVILQVNEIALIDLNNTTSITLSTNAPGAGGEAPTGDSDSSKLLQYTSLVAPGLTRNITVQWGATDTAPAGTSLDVEATNVPGNCGTGSGVITLSNVAQILISSIGSCATGTGANGSELTYTFNIDNVNDLVVGSSSTVNITFTLTDAS